MYVLAKFLLHIQNEITALKSNKSRKIDLYSKSRENKLQALNKTGVQTQNLHVRVCQELRNGLLGKMFLPLSCITTKLKSIKKQWS